MEAPKSVRLADGVEFDPKALVLRAGGIECPLPKATNQTILVSTVWSKKKGVGWEVLYQKMTGIDPMDLHASGEKEKGGAKDVVMNAMDAVNRKARQTFGTDESLFSSSNNVVRRNY
jgi:hypothetical protein